MEESNASRSSDYASPTQANNQHSASALDVMAALLQEAGQNGEAQPRAPSTAPPQNGAQPPPSFLPQQSVQQQQKQQQLRYSISLHAILEAQTTSAPANAPSPQQLPQPLRPRPRVNFADVIPQQHQQHQHNAQQRQQAATSLPPVLPSSQDDSLTWAKHVLGAYSLDELSGAQARLLVPTACSIVMRNFVPAASEPRRHHEQHQHQQHQGEGMSSCSPQPPWHTQMTPGRDRSLPRPQQLDHPHIGGPMLAAVAPHGTDYHHRGHQQQQQPPAVAGSHAVSGATSAQPRSATPHSSLAGHQHPSHQPRLLGSTSTATEMPALTQQHHQQPLMGSNWPFSELPDTAEAAGAGGTGRRQHAETRTPCDGSVDQYAAWSALQQRPCSQPASKRHTSSRAGLRGTTPRPFSGPPVANSFSQERLEQPQPQHPRHGTLPPRDWQQNHMATAAANTLSELISVAGETEVQHGGRRPEASPATARAHSSPMASPEMLSPLLALARRGSPETQRASVQDMLNGDSAVSLQPNQTHHRRRRQCSGRADGTTQGQLCPICGGPPKKPTTWICNVCYSGVYNDIIKWLDKKTKRIDDAYSLNQFISDLQELPRGCDNQYKCTKAKFRFDLPNYSRCTRCRTIAVCRQFPDKMQKLLQRKIGDFNRQFPTP